MIQLSMTQKLLHVGFYFIMSSTVIKHLLSRKHIVDQYRIGNYYKLDIRYTFKHLVCKMKGVVLIMAVLAIKTWGVNSKEYDMEKIMGDAKKEIMEDLQRLTINGASSRKFSRKKFTEL